MVPVCSPPRSAMSRRDLAGSLKPRLTEYDLSIYGAGPAGPLCGRLRGIRGPAHGAPSSARPSAGKREQAPSSENYMGFPGGISGSSLADAHVSRRSASVLSSS